jgi:FMN reductase
MSDLLGIVGSRSSPSHTRTALEVALDAAEEKRGANTEVLHLAEYDLVPADGRSLDAYTGDTAEALERIIDSSAYVIGTPVYRASYSGVLKNLFDMIPRGMWQADVAPLAHSAVGLVGTGATPHHYLVVEKELAPVLSFFGAHLVGSGAYAHNGHYGDDHTLTDDEVRERLRTLGAATVDLHRAIDDSGALSELGPQF